MNRFARVLDGRSHIQLLLHWRWLVLVIAIPISLVIEILEGNSHGLHFLDEVIIDGLVLPFSTWAVLTVVAKKVALQFKREEALERRQQFLQRLAEHRDLGQLARFITRFPATFLPISQASLFVCDQESDQLKLVTEWGAADSMDDPLVRFMPAVPYTPSPDHTQELRLLLIHDHVQIGVLQLRCQENKRLTADQGMFLLGLLPNIAQALAQTIEESKQAERLYREAQAYERRRITQELHDSLAQQVFYLHLGLDQIAGENALLANASLQRRVANMRDVAADIYEQIRNNLSILRAWEQVNITEAITELARSTAHTADLAVEISVEGEADWLSPHTCEHIYGVVREGLHNIVKHARARHVRLAILWTTDALHITLADDGVGVDMAQVPRIGHYGITLMREAIDALHGTFDIESTLGSGTRLCVSVPLRRRSSSSVVASPDSDTWLRDDMQELSLQASAS